MRPTHHDDLQSEFRNSQSEIRHHSHDGNDSNNATTKTARKQRREFMKRSGTLPVAFLVVGALAAGFIVVSGRAAGSGIHLPASLAKIFASRTVRDAVAPTTMSSQVRKPLAPLAVDQFFDGSTTNALTASKWAATNAGPFTSAFVTGNTAVFATVNGTGTGSTGITVGGIRSEENFTMNSPSGTLATGGTVATVNVFSGKKLDFTAVNISAAAGTGLNKSGTGELVLTSGGTFTGGFTLGAGRMTAGGVNAMGAGGALNLNGGVLTVNSSTNRDFTGKYTGGISIGGDVQFGDAANVPAGTGNMTFSNNVALGAATRTITIGGNGTYTLGGIISGSAGSGLTVTNVSGATGTLTLSGVNTYSGDTTISGGKVSLGSTGSMASSPNIIIAGGATFDVSTRGSFTLASAQGLKGTGTATTGTIATAASNGLTTGASSPLVFSLASGVAPLTISGAGTVTVAAGNPVTVNTTSALGAGDYPLIAKGASGTVAGTVPTSLTIGGSGLAAGMSGMLQLTGSQLVLHVAAAGSLQFSAAPYSDSETNADHTFTVNVSRTGGSNGAVSVNYAVTDGTANSSDYTASPASGTLNWADTDTANKTFNITVKGDTTPEADETVNLTLSAATGGATIGAPNPTTLTITNDDPLFYRSVASGNWNSNATWEQSFDNSTWVPATSTPNSANADTITIRSPHMVTVTANVNADQSTVDLGGTLTVNSGITLTIDDGANTDLLVNGTANVNGTGVIGGAGSFNLSSGATLGIGSAAGITSSGAAGSIQVSGSRFFNGGANYVYQRNATGAQLTGNGLPIIVTGSLTVALGVSADSPLALSQAMETSGLTITSGEFDVNGFSLAFTGTTFTNNGSLRNTLGAGQFTFRGSGAQSYAGTGTFGTNATPFQGLGLSIFNSSGVTVSSPVVTTRVNLNTGQFANSSQITIGNGGASSAIIDVGGASLAPGSFDVAPTFNVGSGGLLVRYDLANQTITTGNEIPASRTIRVLVINNTSGLVLSGGSLSLAGNTPSLDLISGTFNVGAGNTISIGTGGNVNQSGTGAFSSGANGGTISFLGTGTVTGIANFNNVVVAGGVSFSVGSTIGAGGQLRIDNGGGVFSPPAYDVTSTLQYNTGGSFTVNSEWLTGTSGLGVPGNVQTSTSGTLLSFGSIATSRTARGNLTIDSSTTIQLSSTAGGDLNVKGNWSNGGTFTANGRTVTFNGASSQTIGGANSTAFSTLAISNTGAVNNNIVSLAKDMTVSTALNITQGVFDQGILTNSSNLSSNTVTVSSGATMQDLGTGDLTLSGDVSNAGTITFNANGTSCGDADDILLRSSVNGTQRIWSGAGTFNMTDVNVQDQRTPVAPPPVAIVVTSGTNAGNNTGWAFSGTCSAGTYTWVGGINADWQVATNWSPARAVPAAGDILILDGNATPGPIITNVPTQTIAALRLINGVFATLNASSIGAPQTLTLSGATGTDLSVPSGTLLTLASANALKISVASGSTGTVGGQIIFQDGAHRLVGNAASAITFPNGALFTTSTGFTGNAFGSGAGGDGVPGSIVFASGSSYSHNAGGSPFGASGNPSVVTFQTGSAARYFTATGFDANGRTYADLSIGKTDPGGVEVDASDSGAGNFQFDNLTINSTGSADSSLTFSGSGANAINIKGNITSNGVGTGGTLQDVILTAGSGGININKAGGGTIVFGNSSNARGMEFESNATVASGTTLSLARKLLVSISQPSSLVITVDGALTGSASGYVIGNEKRSYTAPEAFTYHLGTINGYSPLDVNVTAGTGDLTALARQGARPTLNSATSLQRYWTLTEGGAITADLTFHYNTDALDVMGNEANYRLIVVESGNATSFPENCPDVACVDETANTIRRTGVTTFSDWTAGEPAAPTAVKLTGFTATSNGDDVMLEWQTGYEANNLGYNIYREQDGKRVPITPSLVAGSALIAGSQTTLTAGLTYTWYDEEQTADGRQQTAGSSEQKSAVDGRRSAVTYWLEDVDLDGRRTLHGPIAVAECGMGNADCKKISKHSPTFSELDGSLANPQSAIRNQQSGVEFNGGPAITAGLKGAQPAGDISLAAEIDPVKTQQRIAGMPGVKISISKPGWYRVTKPEMQAAGLDTKDAPLLQLYVRGGEVPIKVSGDGRDFAASDYVEFYGQGLASPTDAAQTYYLIAGSSAGKRIDSPGGGFAADSATSVKDPSARRSFAYTIERKERMIYFSGLLNGDQENFFGQIVSTTATSATIPVSHLDAAHNSAQLEIALQGATRQSHLVQVRFNGIDVGTMDFANTEHPKQVFTIAGSALFEGNNTVQLTSLGGAADVSLVDTMRLTYDHLFEADRDSLSFTLNRPQVTRVSGFTNRNIRAVDITDPLNPAELKAEVSEAGDGSFAADVEARDASFQRPAVLLAFTDDRTAAPDRLRANDPSSWWSEAAGADYLIITTRDLMANVEPLAQLRRNRGMVVKVVDVEDLYDELTFGEHSPRAIHDFFADALANWTRKPAYVLFAGDASYDPKNYFGNGFNDLVPTKLIDTTLMETASDDWLADFNHDGMADISLGRLPVSTAAQVDTMVGKIVSYENTAPDPTRGAVLVADNSFEGASSAVGSLLPSGMTVATINRSSSDDATIHSQIITALNQGPLVANYFGHGSNGVWTGASLLSSDDAPALTNTNRLSVFTMMTCFNGFFQDAANDSLSEALLKSQGGAVAVWASTTLTDPAGQNAIDQEFYRLLFGAQPATLGDAARAAKFVTTDADVRRTWTLFGDPALRLR